MKFRRRWAALAVACSLIVCGQAGGQLLAQTSYPMLMSLKPTAVQTGSTSEVSVQSRYNLFGAYQVLVSGTGVSGEVLNREVKEGEQPPNLQSLKIRFQVAADALPGVRDFRLIGPTGASTVGQVVIVTDPVLVESSGNDTLDKATSVQFPATLCGTIEKAEDVDLFRFQIESPQTLVFHMRSMRLQDRIHDLQQHVDPIVSLRDAAGSTLAMSDNVFAADPLLVYEFTQPGEYVLEVRDVRYQGNQYWEYALEVSPRPFVVTAHPLVVTAGTESELNLVGPLTPAEHVRVTVPAEAPAGAWMVASPIGPGGSNPLLLQVADLPVVVEAGDSAADAAGAQPIAVPGFACGRIDAASDVDCFAFEAKKGEAFAIEVLAGRLNSELDAHLRVLDGSGKQLALADDMTIGKRTNSDSALDSWTAPADGTFLVEVRDLHLRGGPTFPYAIRIERARPFFRLFLDTDKTELTPGTAGVVFARVERKNGFTGEVQLQVEGLPPGVVAHGGRILPDKAQDACIILEAAAEAAPAATNIRVFGVGTHVEGESSTELRAEAVAYQETYQPGGGRGHWPVEMHTVAVGAASDIRRLTLDVEELVLIPGESRRIEVEIERAEGFDKNVTLDVQFRHLAGVFGDPLPPGVTLDAKNSKTLLTGKETKGHVTLVAAKDAKPVDRQLVSLMANVSLNFVMKATYSSRPLWVTVAPAN